MALINSLARVFSTRENKSNPSTSTPARARSQAGSKRSKTSRIVALREVLLTPISDPTLQLMLNSLPSDLRRRRSARSSDLCSVHAILASEPLVEIADLLTFELHRRLAHLYEVPPAHLTSETQTYLYQTLRQYRVYFREQPRLHADKIPDCESTLGTPCLACTLSLFFRDKAAVEALAICAKSRRQKGAEWPALLDWLEGGVKIDGWEDQWIRDGENVRRDRKKARRWRKSLRDDKENEDVHLVAVETGGKKYFREEDLDKDRTGDDLQFQAWLYEQKTRAEQFSSGSNHSDNEPAYDEMGICPNPFDDVIPDMEPNIGHTRADTNDYPDKEFGIHPDPFADVVENHRDDDGSRSEAFLSTYETLTASKASPGVVEQISQGEYEPPEWRRRRRP
ncbi:hypothetical protein MMC07_008129 [Pseudocyphellaria aurata]|nr:hypothetical protein [Pseudocyphellaria aurata]